MENALAPEEGNDWLKGAGVRTLDVYGFGNAGQARGQGKGGPEDGLEELCVR